MMIYRLRVGSRDFDIPTGVTRPAQRRGGQGVRSLRSSSRRYNVILFFGDQPKRLQSAGLVKIRIKR